MENPTGSPGVSYGGHDALNKFKKIRDISPLKCKKSQRSQSFHQNVHSKCANTFTNYQQNPEGPPLT